MAVKFEKKEREKPVANERVQARLRSREMRVTME